MSQHEDVSAIVSSASADPVGLPSIGSAGHEQGLCKRCAFFPKGRCKNGADCTHCHMEHPKQVRHRRRPQNRQGRRADEIELVHPQTLEVNMYVAKAQQDAAATLQELRAADEDCSDDEDVEGEGSDYYVSHVLPRCDEAFWSKLHGDFPSRKQSVVAVAPHKPVKTADFEAGPDAETTCGSGASDTDTTQSPYFSTDNEAKYNCLISCDESSDADALSSKLKTAAVPRSSEGRDLVQVEVRSITEAEATPDELEGAVPQTSGKSEAKPGSWAAQQKLRRAEQEKETEFMSAEACGRKALGLLNKLTQERFESIRDQVIALPVTTTEHMGAMVAAIFEKATTEKGFLGLHTELCASLDSHFALETSQMGGKVFRKALVSECQACFERNIRNPFNPETVATLSYEDRYELEVRHKTRTLGNMRFIGQLLARKLLAAKVFFFIVNEMLDIGNDAALESLAELLQIVAPVFENKQSIYSAPLREVFAALKKKSKDSKVSTCIRCKLCDLLDARARSWVPRDVVQLQQ